MKKLITLLMIASIALGMVGCNDKEGADQENTQNTANAQTTVSEKEESKTTASVKKDWGRKDKRVCINENEEMSHYMISYPSTLGKNMGSGACAPQVDSTLVLVDAQSSTDTPHMTSLDELFPGQFEQTIEVLSTYYSAYGSDYALDLKSQEHVEINGYDMIRIEGTFTFKELDKPRNYKWVGYATVMKSNGSYVYWMVMDTSDDLSKADIVEEDALNMAYSFCEVEE